MSADIAPDVLRTLRRAFGPELDHILAGLPDARRAARRLIQRAPSPLARALVAEAEAADDVHDFDSALRYCDQRLDDLASVLTLPGRRAVGGRFRWLVRGWRV